MASSRRGGKGGPPRGSGGGSGTPAGDYAVANLALWAGDFLTAEELLLGIAPRGSGAPSPFEDPVLSSARRLLGRLRRRMREYRRLATSAGLPAGLVEAAPA